MFLKIYILIQYILVFCNRKDTVQLVKRKLVPSVNQLKTKCGKNINDFNSVPISKKSNDHKPSMFAPVCKLRHSEDQRGWLWTNENYSCPVISKVKQIFIEAIAIEQIACFTSQKICQACIAI